MPEPSIRWDCFFVEKGDVAGAKEAFDKAAQLRANEETAKEKSLRRGAARAANNIQN
jgi:hypothetical protein